jgi:hypothetical protein
MSTREYGVKKTLPIKTEVGIRFFLAECFYDIEGRCVMRYDDAFFFGILRESLA